MRLLEKCLDRSGLILRGDMKQRKPIEIILGFRLIQPMTGEEGQWLEKDCALGDPILGTFDG